MPQYYDFHKNKLLTIPTDEPCDCGQEIHLEHGRGCCSKCGIIFRYDIHIEPLYTCYLCKDQGYLYIWEVVVHRIPDEESESGFFDRKVPQLSSARCYCRDNNFFESHIEKLREKLSTIKGNATVEKAYVETQIADAEKAMTFPTFQEVTKTGRMAFENLVSKLPKEIYWNGWNSKVNEMLVILKEHYDKIYGPIDAKIKKEHEAKQKAIRTDKVIINNTLQEKQYEY